MEQITASSGPLHSLATSLPVKRTLVLIVHEDEWATGPVWTVLEKKNLALAGIRTQTV